jgi:EAL domain-containing protein (putative c-di-GMP-specific phosphodiesterase class I)
MSAAIQPSAAAGDSAAAHPRPEPEKRVEVDYDPILDVAGEVVAGFQAQPRRDPSAEPDGADGRRSAQVIMAALETAPTAPPNAFLTVPVRVGVVAGAAVRAALRSRGNLAGIVLDLTGPFATTPDPALEAAVADYRQAGALIAISGYGTSQSQVANLVRLRPSILRLGRDWVRGIDRSHALHSTVKLVGQLADHFDAWLLAEGVTTAGELRALRDLEVPLAQGPFISATHRASPGSPPADDPLRELLHPAHTTLDPDRLPESPDADVAVVVDEGQRPVALFERRNAGEWLRREVLAVEVGATVAEAVRRAVRRPPGFRFVPLACVDEDGRLLGVLKVERLLAQLTGGA